tara:strand:- start:112 stop:288 length:177 start_codon:yes stop_codon:yes gene_type:complete
MELKCKCDLLVTLKPSYDSLSDSTIVRDFNGICKCGFVLSFRIYELDEDEVETIKGYV